MPYLLTNSIATISITSSTTWPVIPPELWPQYQNAILALYLGQQQQQPQSSLPLANWTTLDPMFLPTGSGALYYHSISSTTSLTMPYVYSRSTLPVRPPTIWRPPLARPMILAGRRALRRSIDLFCMLRPAHEIRTFLSGQPLIVPGCHYDYRVQKRDNLLQHTMHPDSPHIPYDLHILDKASGQRLAKGCVVISGTPVIDQLLVLLLHVQDPEEEKVVIRRTNWSPRLTNLRMAA